MFFQIFGLIHDFIEKNRFINVIHLNTNYTITKFFKFNLPFVSIFDRISWRICLNRIIWSWSYRLQLGSIKDVVFFTFSFIRRSFQINKNKLLLLIILKNLNASTLNLCNCKIKGSRLSQHQDFTQSTRKLINRIMMKVSFNAWKCKNKFKQREPLVYILYLLRT